MVVHYSKIVGGKEVRLTVSTSNEDEEDFSFHQRSVSDAKDLRALARKAAKKKDLGKTVIYFGCRNSRMDHIYKEELEKCKMNGALDEVHVAFSRDKEVMERVHIHVYASGIDCDQYLVFGFPYSIPVLHTDI